MTVHAAHKLAIAARRLISVADLDRMIEAGIIDDDEKVELIDGELFVMAAKKFAHELVKSSLVRIFNRSGSDALFVGIEASLRLDAHTLVEPDILVCRRDRLAISPEGYLEIPAAEILLLVEVADSTLRKDRTTKARLYARYGVAEYWIVDARKRTIWRHREPRLSAYATVDPLGASEAVSPGAPDLAAITVRLAEIG